MKVETHEETHHQFFEPQDHIQNLYEQARKGALDRRCRQPEEVYTTIKAHGVAGLTIEPVQSFLSSTVHSRQGSRACTAFHQTHLTEETFSRIACSLAEGVGVRTTARIMGVDKKTVIRVLERSAHHVALVSQSLLKDIFVLECQLDEMWSFVYKKEGHLDPFEKSTELMGDAWIWIAFDPLHKLILAHAIGKRTEAVAVKLVQEIKQVTSRIPGLFTSDQLDQYKSALLKEYGVSILPPRKPGPGRPPHPKLVPPDDLLYAQVVKEYKQNSLNSISRKVVFGDSDKVQEILNQSLTSQKINTSFVERYNGTIRHMDARCNRKTYRFSKCRENHELQLQLSMGYYHLCLPHNTLSKWYGRQTTPFMSAGLTDHVWTMHELLETKTKIPNI